MFYNILKYLQINDLCCNFRVITKGEKPNTPTQGRQTKNFES